MKKTILAFTMLLCGALGASAQDYIHSLIVNKTDGTKVEYKFSDNPVATINGDNLSITTEGASEAVLHPLADLQNLTFEKSVSGVKDIVAEKEGRVSFTLMKEALLAEGLPAGVSVTIYDAQGRIVARQAGNDKGSVAVPVTQLGKGVFLVKAGKNNFKFIR